MIIFSYFSSKPYVVTPHLNRLIETVQLRGHNICCYAELTKIILIITIYSLLSRSLSNTDIFARLHVTVVTEVVASIPGPSTYFRGNRLWNLFYGHFPHFH